MKSPSTTEHHEERYGPYGTRPWHQLPHHLPPASRATARGVDCKWNNDDDRANPANNDGSDWLDLAPLVLPCEHWLAVVVGGATGPRLRVRRARGHDNQYPSLPLQATACGVDKGR
jgi:hypothetical protein